MFAIRKWHCFPIALLRKPLRIDAFEYEVVHNRFCASIRKSHVAVIVANVIRMTLDLNELNVRMRLHHGYNHVQNREALGKQISFGCLKEDFI